MNVIPLGYLRRNACTIRRPLLNKPNQYIDHNGLVKVKHTIKNMCVWFRPGNPKMIKKNMISGVIVFLHENDVLVLILITFYEHKNMKPRKCTFRCNFSFTRQYSLHLKVHLVVFKYTR